MPDWLPRVRVDEKEDVRSNSMRKGCNGDEASTTSVSFNRCRLFDGLKAAAMLKVPLQCKADCHFCFRDTVCVTLIK